MSDTKSPVVITIDGPAGVGKSTVARLLAKRLDVVYLDTGATYRAVAYLALKAGHDPVKDIGALAEIGQTLPIRFEQDSSGETRVWLEGEEITDVIRQTDVTEASAQVAQHGPVRAALVNRQRELAAEQSVVVEGRDTGSVVFPDASVKFFLDADPMIRAKRRQDELAERYGTTLPLEQVREQLHFRDALDRKRLIGPLIQPDDAILIDSSNKPAEEVVSEMLTHIKEFNAKR